MWEPAFSLMFQQRPFDDTTRKKVHNNKEYKIYNYKIIENIRIYRIIKYKI